MKGSIVKTPVYALCLFMCILFGVIVINYAMSEISARAQLSLSERTGGESGIASIYASDGSYAGIPGGDVYTGAYEEGINHEQWLLPLVIILPFLMLTSLFIILCLRNDTFV
jgi:hypothetical protein